MIYCRINLEETDYKMIDFEVQKFSNIDALLTIYESYCKYKGFKSVMPLFRSEFRDDSVDVIVYTHNGKEVGFSLNKKHDDENVESIQFAWDYDDPSLRLGINSLMSECAYYKQMGYKYFYLGEAADYKKLDGYEQV